MVSSNSRIDGYHGTLGPLSFDRVMENRPLAAVTESKLFMLPTEILDQIVEAIPQSSLSSLALVSTTSFLRSHHFILQ
jgi:hypothetical protein